MSVTLNVRFQNWNEYYALMEKLRPLGFKPAGAVRTKDFYKTAKFQSYGFPQDKDSDKNEKE